MGLRGTQNWHLCFNVIQKFSLPFPPKWYLCVLSLSPFLLTLFTQHIIRVKQNLTTLYVFKKGRERMWGLSVHHVIIRICLLVMLSRWYWTYLCLFIFKKWDLPAKYSFLTDPWHNDTAYTTMVLVTLQLKGSFALGDDDVDNVDSTTTSSWNGYSTHCMMTLSYYNLSSSSGVNSPIGYHATHIFCRHRRRLVRTSP